jgi:hypothetical protein
MADTLTAVRGVSSVQQQFAPKNRIKTKIGPVFAQVNDCACVFAVLPCVMRK